MYICVHMYNIYIYIYIYIHIYIYIYTYIYIYIPPALGGARCRLPRQGGEAGGDPAGAAPGYRLIHVCVLCNCMYLYIYIYIYIHTYT